MRRANARAPGSRAIAALLAAAQLACLGPRREYASAAGYVQGAAPPRVTVNLNDGRSVEITGAQVVLDSLLTGWTNEGTEFVGFPLTDVRSVSTRERSPGRTAALMTAIITTVVVAVVAFNGTGPGPVLPGEPGEEEEEF